MDEFPLYSLVIQGAKLLLTLDEAMGRYNHDLPVEIDRRVVDKDGSIREISELEEGLIRWGRAE